MNKLTDAEKFPPLPLTGKLNGSDMTTISSRNENSPQLVGGKYELGERFGEGSFGVIFHATNKNTGEKVAAKLEERKAGGRSSQLKRETKIYSKLDGEVGVPRVRWFGVETYRRIMIMDLLGRSLEDLFNFCERSFSLKTVLVIGYELMCRIETIHSKGLLIHRDIKPENMLLGRGRERHTVYIIDFGLAKYYKNPRTGKHIPCTDGHNLTGTARYASINAHAGMEQSCRDDLYSIGYVLMYFLRGSLPWQQGLRSGGKEAAAERYRKIHESKLATSNEALCQGFPAEFRRYFDHLDNLGFEDFPDYSYMKNLFKDLFVRSEYTYDEVLFDWEVRLQKQQQQQQQQWQK